MSKFVIKKSSKFLFRSCKYTTCFCINSVLSKSSQDTLCELKYKEKINTMKSKQNSLSRSKKFLSLQRRWKSPITRQIRFCAYRHLVILTEVSITVIPFCYSWSCSRNMSFWKHTEAGSKGKLETWHFKDKRPSHCTWMPLIREEQPHRQQAEHGANYSNFKGKNS